jgi:hypothetical protein
MTRYHAGNPRPLPSVDVLREHVAVSASSPSGLVWVRRKQGRRLDRRAGAQSRTGHWQITIVGASIPVHRVVWALTHGSDPGDGDIDHIDGNGGNNDPSNLRVCSRSENTANSRAMVGCSSRYKGVALHVQKQRRGLKRVWWAYMRCGDRQTSLGMHATGRDAAAAYNRAVFAERGSFSRLNDLDNPGETLSATEITTDELRARVGLPLEGEQ